MLSETSYRHLNLNCQSLSLALKDARLPCRTTEELMNRKRICFFPATLELFNFTFKIPLLPLLSRTFGAASNAGVAVGTLQFLFPRDAANTSLYQWHGL